MTSLRIKHLRAALVLVGLGAATCLLAAQEKDDGQWTMAAKNYANTRYSELAQINTTTAKNLVSAWTFSTGVLRGHEAAPLIVNNTMYVVTPWPNLLYALDMTKPGARP